jgi:Predicted ATPase
VVLGRTGTGKSNLLRNISKNILVSDDTNLIVVDFHGQLARKIINMNEKKELIFIGPNQEEGGECIRMNLLKNAAESSISLYLIQEIFSGEASLSMGTWGPRLQLIFTSILREVLKQNQHATINTFLQTLLSRGLMKALLDKSSGETKLVLSNLISKWSSWVEYSTSSVNKIFPIVSDPFLNSVASSPEESLDLIREMRQGNKLLIIDVSKTTISAPQGRILSSLILNRLWSDILKSDIVPRTVIMIDEAQNLNSTILSELLSEGRKFNLYLILASQFISQYPKSLRESIKSNTGSIYAFNISRDDASEVCSIITDRNLYKRTMDSILLGKPHNVTHVDLLNKEGIMVNSFVPTLIQQEYEEERVGNSIKESLNKFGTGENSIVENVLHSTGEHTFLMTIMERYLMSRGIYVEKEKKLSTLRPDLFFFKDNTPFICEVEVSDLDYFSRIVEKICNYIDYELILLVPRDRSLELLSAIADNRRVERLTKNLELRNAKTIVNLSKVLIVEERGNLLYARTGEKLVRFSVSKIGKIHSFMEHPES